MRVSRRRTRFVAAFAICATVLGLAVATGSGPASAAGTTTYNPYKDTYVDAGTPSTNFGTSSTVSTDASPEARGLFAFNVTVPSGEHVTSATISCYTISANSAGGQWYTSGSSWIESGTNSVTWNNRPTIGASSLGSTGATTAGAYSHPVDVTSSVTTSGNVAFALKTTSTTKWSCASRENSGNHPAKLVVTTAANANQPPVASFVNPPSCTNLACTFNGSASSDPDGTIASYDWNFGDGTAHGTGATPAHTYATAGTYTVTLVVTDNQGATGTVSHSVTVTAANQPPVAEFEWNDQGLNVAVDGTGSSDADGTVVSYDWDWGDGSAHGTGVTANHNYLSSGTYTITLIVTDNQGAQSAPNAQQVTVTAPGNSPPTAAFTSSCTNLVCAYDGSGSVDTDGTIANYAWDFGDGLTSNTNAIATINHTYAAAGTYNVTLTVTDNQGATGVITNPVTVSSATHTNTTLPARGAFYYPWFPEAWNQNGVNPATHYNPTLGFYNTTDAEASHVQSMVYGNFNFAISSWWGQGHYTDTRFGTLLTAAHGTTLKAAPYYECEGNTCTTTAGSPDPSSATITGDLNYIAGHYINDPNYMWVNNKPVIFVYNANDTTCALADKWAAANAAATTHFYVVLKVFSGYAGCTSQPDNWHQYGPASATDQQGSHSISISPGYWKYDTGTPLLARGVSAFTTNVGAMNCAAVDFKLVTTFNEWGEGSSVESASQWSSASGNGQYLDVLHNNTTCGGTDNPPAAALTVTPATGIVPFTVTADASGSTDIDSTPMSTYAFDWGDGGTTSAQASATATHSYTVAGTYTVTVTVTDTAGKTGTATKTVTASAPGTDNPPVAALSVSPTTGTVPFTDTADASASTDTDATPISTYTFDFGDGSAVVGPQAGATATHSYTVAGTYTVTVTVTDTAGKTGTATKTVTANAVVTGLPHYDHIFFVMEENKQYSDIMADPNVQTFVGQGSIGDHVSAITHPSVNNYLADVSGTEFDGKNGVPLPPTTTSTITDNCTPTTTACSTSAWNVFDGLESAGKTWGQYAESQPTPCYLVHDATPYAERHTYANYFNQIRNTPSRCNQGKPYTSLATDLASAATTPNLVMITPNLNNDMHDGTVAAGGTWLKNNMPTIFNSPAWTTQHSLLIITEDENDGTNPVPQSMAGGIVPLIFVASDGTVTPHKVDHTVYNQYDTLRTIEDSLGVTPGGPGDKAGFDETNMFH